MCWSSIGKLSAKSRSRLDRYVPRIHCRHTTEFFLFDFIIPKYSSTDDTLLMLSWRTVDRSVDQYASDKKTPPDQDIGLYSADIRMNLDRVLAHVVVSINWQSTEMQRAKKVVSDSPRLVDFVVGLVNSVLNLPNRQVKYFEESTYRKTVKSKFFCSSKNLGG